MALIQNFIVREASLVSIPKSQKKWRNRQIFVAVWKIVQQLSKQLLQGSIRMQLKQWLRE